MTFPLLDSKIRQAEYAEIVRRYAADFSAAENMLLNEILERFEFDPVQAQALAQAVLQQSRFDPDAAHIFDDEDEDVTGVCPHCINPPAPPLRDYLMWRESTAA